MRRSPVRFRQEAQPLTCGFSFRRSPAPYSEDSGVVAAERSYDQHTVKEIADGNPDVYATQATEESIAPLGIAGSQLFDFLTDDGRISPTTESFGAEVFSSDGTGNLAPTTEHGAHIGHGQDASDAESPADDGGGYLDDNTQSLDSISRIISGQGDRVETAKSAAMLRIINLDMNLEGHFARH